MTKEERQRQSNIITSKVLNSADYQNSRRICVYLSMDEEVSTKELLRDIFISGKSCFVPRYTQTNMEMLRLHSWQDFETLPLTKWNIRQPSEKDNREEALTSGGLDLILVPGLGFTNQGNRIGRGKGYYDRYLEKCAATSQPPVAIGLAFMEQIVSEIPSDATDITLDYIVSSN
ncbi:unnamed protein product [Allacma fusca]|uniref:5-formyltetrahydrofolate cyclo-ligase n=1 Tax=Allacma fusca TaxID=39272 RepID=A0A8J2KPQ6_9HEXA|nr:unnamed protein product [Allacma fusca]